MRADTGWVPEYVAAVRRIAAGTDVELACGIEAKLLDTTGALDLPDGTEGVDVIYAADHQVPLAEGPTHPREVKERIESGDLAAGDVLEAIVTSTARALDRETPVVIAHFFSILPKIGLAEADAPEELIDWLAAETARTGQRIEVSERWRCPSADDAAPVRAPRRADPAQHGQPLARHDRAVRPLPRRPARPRRGGVSRTWASSRPSSPRSWSRAPCR